MDTASVIRAWRGVGNLSADNTTFQWSAGDTVLTVTPNLPFELGECGDVRCRYSWRNYMIGAEAVDLSGNPMDSDFRASFRTAATKTFVILPEHELTNYVYRENLGPDGTMNRVGDTRSNLAYRSFVSFQVPTGDDGHDDALNVLAFESASVNLLKYGTVGAPWEFDGIFVESVRFDDITEETYMTDVIRREGIINADSRSTDVSPSFQRDVNDGLEYTQFRLSMRPSSDFDGVFDYIWFNDEDLQLTVKALVE